MYSSVPNKWGSNSWRGGLSNVSSIKKRGRVGSPAEITAEYTSTTKQVLVKQKKVKLLSSTL